MSALAVRGDRRVTQAQSVVLNWFDGYENPMNFTEAVAYLYARGHELAAMKLGLERIAALTQAFAQPQSRYPIAQIAGTNGKGSTAAMTAAIAQAAGVKTGLFTSPHLVKITERICVNGVQIAPDDFARLATSVREAGAQLMATGVLADEPSLFEQITMIALLYFAEQRVDVAVLEVGLGGRFDATTICAPTVTAITPIAFDHMRLLGNTLAAIAGEKAGIIKPGVPLVVAQQPDEALGVIQQRAAELNAPVISVAEELRAATLFQTEALTLGQYRIRYRSRRTQYDAVLNLRGKHQVDNALVAIHLAEQLQDAGVAISAQAIVTGLERAEWPGRLQLLQIAGVPVLLDGAHNPAGAQVLREFLAEHCADKPLTLLFGAMADKAVDEIIPLLFPLAQRVVLAKVNNPRAAEPQAMADLTREFSGELICASDVADAFATALRVTPPGGLVCVCGSLFLLGELAPHLTAYQ